MVIWVIGLSGAGKTTLSKEIVKQVQKVQKNIILIDGDAVRELFGNDLGYTLHDRQLNADRICRLCKFLDDQGIHVVCSILSIFPQSRTWNRENLKNYYEVFIESSIDELIKRDSKGIYGKFLRGEIKDVAGMDISFPIPDKPDLIIYNMKSKAELLHHVESITAIITGGIL